MPKTLQIVEALYLSVPMHPLWVWPMVVVINEVENLALSIRQAFKPTRNFGMLLLLFAALLVRFKCFTNAVKELLIAKWLLDEVDGPFLHGFDGHGYVAMARNENDRKGIFALDQFFLQLEAAKAGHANIEDKTARSLIAYFFEKLVR